MNIAVILAGGSGTRFGGERPKQFFMLGGKTALERSIEIFERNEHIDEIAVVIRADYIDEVREMVARNAYGKVRRILTGGAERYHSALAAISAYTDDDDCLFFHDAVRPMVTQRTVNDCAEAIGRYDAVDVGLQTVDTIIRVGEDGCIAEIPPRRNLRNGQTPQVFRRGVIAKAYGIGLKDPAFATTDECGVVLKYLPEVPIYVVDGDVRNNKLTYPEDVIFFERLIELDESGC